MTVLFADLKGSMELLADRDPEEARKLLDPVIERMMEAVHHFEGTVNQVMGDGIMALFGAPLAHEDHAVRAGYAALRMQEQVRRYAEQTRRSHGVEVQIRVGLNSGEVVVRSIGSDLHMDYTAVGQTTHLAARMEQLATPGTIRLTGETLRLAEGYIQVKPLGPIPIKGLADPVEVYEATGAGPVRTRFQAVATRGLTRFIGRDAELEQLRRALQLAGEGRGQVVAVVGEAGVGKSRLFYEFTHSHRTQGWLVLESGSVSYGKATSYLPVIDLLKEYFKIHDRDDHREIHDKVLGRVLGLDRSLEPLLPALLALLDIPAEDPQWQAFDPSQRRQRTLDAVKRLLIRESQVQPLLLMFEDLHWIDGETQALLDGLVDGVAPCRLLLLVNFRPEYQHAWSGKTYYTQLRLDALPPETTGELLRALLGDDPGLEPLKQLLIKRGNPFFIEESVRTLVETKALAGERGAYRLMQPVKTIQVPATVQAVLAARIDRLPAEEKRLLQTAAVIGKDVPFALLQAIGELPEEALNRGLTHLQAGEFLYETSLFPDLEYTFKHALTHEVAYASLLQERRRASHARIVEAIETLYAERLVEYVERLAHHAFRGELWEQAFHYLRQAGAKAFSRCANQEAVACFEQALVALQRLPERRQTIEQGIDLRFELRSPLWVLGEFERLFDTLREAEGQAAALDDQPRLGRAFGYLVQSFKLMSDHDRAIEVGHRALAIGEAVGDLGVQVMATFHLGQAYFQCGDHRRAIEFHTRTIESLGGDLDYQRLGLAGLPAVFSRGHLAWSLAELGRFAEGIALGQEGIRIAEAAKSPHAQIFSEGWTGYAHFRKGDAEQAIRLLEHALMLCQTLHIRLEFPFIASFLGSAYALCGRFSEALRLLQEAVDTNLAMKVTASRSWLISLLSDANLLAGETNEAADLANRALALAQAHKERGFEAWALRGLGEVVSNCDPAEADHAERWYRQAIALADELGMRPLVAHCHLGLGRLYRQTGEREKARDHLATVTAMYREMDMRCWLEKAEAEVNRPAGSV